MGPIPVLEFLGILLDTSRLEARLPDDKLSRVCDAIAEWLDGWMILIVLAGAVWGPQMAHKTTKFQCDNTGVVAAINKGSAREPFVMHLLHCLWFFTAHFDFSIVAEHIAGAQNCAADHLSRIASFLPSLRHNCFPPHCLQRPWRL